jgi:hypothetical protein
MADHEKQDIERAIDRARDGVGDRIDELDRRLRTSLDVKSAAAEHAPEIIAGGAVLGFLAGFGFPKPLRRAVSIGIPLALIAMKLRKSRVNGDGAGTDYDEI